MKFSFNMDQVMDFRPDIFFKSNQHELIRKIGFHQHMSSVQYFYDFYDSFKLNMIALLYMHNGSLRLFFIALYELQAKDSPYGCAILPIRQKILPHRHREFILR